MPPVAGEGTVIQRLLIQLTDTPSICDRIVRINALFLKVERY